MTRAETLAYQRQNILLEMAGSGLSPTQYVREYNTGKATLQKDIKRFSVPTLYRWKKWYESGGLRSLEPRYHGVKGAGSRTLQKEDKELIQAYYFDENRPPLAQILRLIKRYHKKDINYSTARRYINSLPKAVKILRREGEKAYNDKAAPSIRRDFDALHPMQIVSADHHILDLLCRHPQKGTPFRPWLTMIIDYRSRKPLGWQIAITPNRYTILAALEQCIENYGAPKEIHIDNGKDFKSKLLNGQKVKIKNADPLIEEETIELQGVFGRLGARVHFAQAYRAQAKPVERFFRVVSETFSKEFPSYTGSNTSDRPADIALYYRRIKGQKKRGDLLELDDVSALFNLWAKRYAAEHRHRGDGMNGRTPDQVFKEETAYPRPIMPTELRELVFAEQFKRTVTKYGISIDNVDYYAEEIIGHIGKKLIARRPFRNRETIIVFDLDGRQLFIAYNNYLSDTKDAKENSRLRAEVNKKQKEILSQYLEKPTARKSLVDELPEARRAVGLNDVVDIASYAFKQKKKKPRNSNGFFKGV